MGGVTVEELTSGKVRVTYTVPSYKLPHWIELHCEQAGGHA